MFWLFLDGIQSMRVRLTQRVLSISILHSNVITPAQKIYTSLISWERRKQKSQSYSLVKMIRSIISKHRAGIRVIWPSEKRLVARKRWDSQHVWYTRVSRYPRCAAVASAVYRGEFFVGLRDLSELADSAAARASCLLWLPTTNSRSLHWGSSYICAPRAPYLRHAGVTLMQSESFWRLYLTIYISASTAAPLCIC